MAADYINRGDGCIHAHSNILFLSAYKPLPTLNPILSIRMSTYSLAMKSWRDVSDISLLVYPIGTLTYPPQKLATEAASIDITFPTLSFGYTFDHPFDQHKLQKIVIMIKQVSHFSLQSHFILHHIRRPGCRANHFPQFHSWHYTVPVVNASAFWHASCLHYIASHVTI